VLGNPAAGRQNGTIQDFRSYFDKCVANGGSPPEQEEQKTTKPPDNKNENNSQAPK
jgi:hypothetical protein